MNVLHEIAAKTKERYIHVQKEIPLSCIKEKALSIERAGDFPFETAISKKGVSFICEIKKASPSKGMIAPDFPYRKIAEEYEAAGASAISCLTEPYWFLGSDTHLREVVQAVGIPVLRKDFTISEYQI
ncbi:MAG: indole-3-glycerol-phosphate synthase TrpC, partial [Actinobacteria bacterium]|nr:indole-3-glycerol-phosphate synthase TrpC [Actinomycetota bacterium]